MDRSWMYNRFLPQCGGISEKFLMGVRQFIDFARSNEDEDEIRCPCRDCANKKFRHPNVVTQHLYRKGFLPNYFQWICHGEPYVDSSTSDNATTSQDRFIELSNVFKEAHPEGMTEEDKCRLWAEAAGVNSKGQMFGQGSLNNTLPDFRNPATPLPSTALSGTLNANQMEDLRKSIEDDLRKSIEEDLRRSITEELQKTMDDKIQHLLIQARQQETRTMQQQRAQFQQMQRFVQTFQLTPYVDPILQADTPFMALLNSTSNPSTSNSLANPSMRVGYVPSQPTSTPFDYDNQTSSGGQN